MRVLLMIGNSNMAVRAIYGLVLREHFAGWGFSNMSGLPFSPGAIVKAYDVLVYELGAPDDPRRLAALESLLAEIEDLKAPRVLTHIEGPYRDGLVARLESRGVICVGTPFGPPTVAEALRRAAPQPTARPAPPAPESTPGGRGRLRGFFRRKE